VCCVFVLFGISNLFSLCFSVMIILSNDVEFGKKEPFMAPFDALLTSARVRLSNFLIDVAERFGDTLDSNLEPVKLPLVLHDESIAIIRSFLSSDGEYLCGYFFFAKSNICFS
jgi:hypothetical protein